jgi:ribosomal protein S18 acetylase RimI-like enzyme
MNITYQKSLPKNDYKAAAELYDEAFGKKFAIAIPDKTKRIALFEKGFISQFAITAYSQDQLVGLAGFQTHLGSLTGGINFELLRKELGFFSALRAALIFVFYDRTLQKEQLLMDGIAVNSNYRGHGIGGTLLDEIIQVGIENGYKEIRLDVIDINPKAKKLYERKQFVATHTDQFPYLKWLFGFSASTTMIRTLDNDS